MTKERFTEIEQLLSTPRPTLHSPLLVKLRQAVADCLNEIRGLQTWVADLQKGMTINCVYCGHQYGPTETTPASGADLLKRHIAECPEHPMSRLLKTTKGAYHLCEALLSCREGVTDELILEIRDACTEAITKTGSR